MKILIIEDEQNNANRLVRLLHEIQPQCDIIAVLSSNAEVKTFFQQENATPDVILSDIQLGDGLSFEGLRTVPSAIPIIFTTAYDEYAIQAFKFNSIDYLLKPVDAEELRVALGKVKETLPYPSTTDAIAQLLASVQSQSIRYRERFLISYRDTFTVVPANEVSHIGIKDGVVHLYTISGQNHTLNITLDDLESQLDPTRFIRANRQFIVNASAIEKLSTFFLGKMRIHLKGYPNTDIIISRDKVPVVKKWLDS
jgi:two-component system LytT family response regulator